MDALGQAASFSPSAAPYPRRACALELEGAGTVIYERRLAGWLDTDHGSTSTISCSPAAAPVATTVVPTGLDLHLVALLCVPSLGAIVNLLETIRILLVVNFCFLFVLLVATL